MGCDNMENQVLIGRGISKLSNKIHRNIAISCSSTNMSGTQGRVLHFILSNNGAVTKEKKMLVYDQMDVLKNQELMQQSFPEYEIQFVDSLSEVKDQVKDGKVDAGFEIRNSSEFVYYVENSSLNDMTSSRFESMMKQNFQTSELKKLGYDVNKVQKVYQSAIASETQVLGKDGIFKNLSKE